MRKYSSGVTLIELMIVVVILSIIAAVAVPSYQDSARKSRRSDAKTLLATATQLMERYYTENGSYLSGSNCGVSLPITSVNGYYKIIAATGCSGTTSTFTLTATPQGAQAGDTGCGNFTLDNKGTKGVTGSLGVSSCW